MPIKPENTKRYPREWKAISLRIRERAGNKCEFCGVENGAVGWRDKEGKFEYAPDYLEVKAGKASFYVITNRLKIVLTVAHLNHQPEDCADDNLKALCQRCHLRYDAEHHRTNAKETRRKKSGQITLF